MALVSVEFLAAVSPYAPGEIAGLDPELAALVVGRRWAKYAEPVTERVGVTKRGKRRPRYGSEQQRFNNGRDR